MAPMAMILIGATISNVAVPSITEGLGASPAAISWVVSGYMIGYALGLVPAGRLGDRYGHKWVFILGLIAYMVTALVASFSFSELQLVVSRVVQGFAGGFVIAPLYAYIQILFTGAARLRAFAIFTVVTGAAALVGPLIGGQIIDMVGMAQGWRFALTAGLPLGALALVAAFPLVPQTRNLTRGRFDFVGMFLLAVVVVGFIAPFIQVTDAGLPEWATASFSTAAVLAVVFAFWIRHRERRDAFPLVPFSFFTRPTFSIGMVVMFLAFAAFTSAIYIALSVLWQAGRGESALMAAMVTLPFSLGSILGGFMAEHTTKLFGRWALTCSLILLVVGLYTTYLTLQTDAQSHLVALVLPLLIAGMGSGIFVAPCMDTVLNGIHEKDAGAAGGFSVTVQRTGAAFGMALVFIAVSQPGPDGSFTPEVMTHDGIVAVLICAALLSVALLLSVVTALATPRAIPAQTPAAPDAAPEEPELEPAGGRG
ncbi:MFS transporter [Arthrobacter ginkgonis]|uniref:MFS transporter n=1 Tax=Arthrobacter ginkgonis TaxID=1630594 RepID=A0ABP7C1J8_9MICC